MIEKLIDRYEKIKGDTKEKLYDTILKKINKFEKLYTILSMKDINKDTGMSVPFVANKDGKPVMFLFSEYEHALNWVKHYDGFMYGNSPAISEIYNNKNEFCSIFQLADYFGIKNILFNEGINMFTIVPSKMIDVNNYSHEIKLILTPEEMEHYNNSNLQPQIKFPYLKIINYKYEELINDEKVNAMMNAVLEGNEGMFFTTNAIEDIFAAEMVRENFVRQAMEKDSMEDVNYFNQIIKSLVFKATKKMIDYSNIWYVINSEEKAPIKRDGKLIITCSDYFKDRMLEPIVKFGIPCDFEKINKFQYYSLIKEMNKEESSEIILTDGRYEITVLASTLNEILSKIVEITSEQEEIMELRKAISENDLDYFNYTSMTADIISMNLIEDEFINSALQNEKDKGLIDKYEELLLNICTKLTEKILRNQRVWYVCNSEEDIPILKNMGVVIAVTDVNEQTLLNPILSENLPAALSPLSLEDFYKLVSISSSKDDECKTIILTDGINEFVIEATEYFKIVSKFFDRNIKNEYGKLYEHIEKNLGVIGNNIGELVPRSKVNVTVNIIYPNEERNYVTLVTTGVSDSPMIDGRYSELMIKLPADYSICPEELNDAEKAWPISILREAAHYPHLFDKPLKELVVIPNDDEEGNVNNFASDTLLNSVLLINSNEDIEIYEDDNKKVEFFTLVPISLDELDKINKVGAKNFISMLAKKDITEFNRRINK